MCPRFFSRLCVTIKPMISKGEEQYVRQAAYLPEHVLPLMTGLSGAEPFIRSDHLLFVAPGSMIFIGYPLT
ncbi:MAG TPA: hypothetical protein VLS90_15640, partial [Thermodesulfobacteriota bacterium]|nr:hypothetical protein [Thermodesulfobacteriota bacterium]